MKKIIAKEVATNKKTKIEAPVNKGTLRGAITSAGKNPSAEKQTKAEASTDGRVLVASRGKATKAVASRGSSTAHKSASNFPAKPVISSPAKVFAPAAIAQSPGVSLKRTASAKPNVKVDMSLSIAQRPLKGIDIEEWVWSARLSKHEAHFALGFRNANHYAEMCKRPLISPTLEILIRLYYRFPDARGWGKFTTRDLYDRLYKSTEDAFEPGSKHHLHAVVDLGSRFCKLFGRSVARQYEWIRDVKPDTESQQYAEIDAILGKLFEIQKHTDAAKVFEEVALHVGKLRGVDINSMYPVPTPENPPTRKKVGRPFSPATAAKRAKLAKAALKSASAGRK